MAIREDLVSSAVTFLQDPSVANAPLDKRIAFLQSKNLTQEEVDVSLARAGDPAAAQASQQSYGYQQGQQAAGQPQQPPYGFNPYQGYWPPPPPLEPPKRDWRDYFIMATVMSGLSYGVYFVAKRYIAPLIAPPTPLQLSQDKAAIDEAFTRAFDLIEQLSNDTAAIKASEESRKERLDSALNEVEKVISDFKTASKQRDEDQRRIGDEVRGLQDLIPKSIKQQEESSDARLKELNGELKSLKTLIANRIGGGASTTSSSRPASQVNGTSMFSSQSSAGVNATGTTPVQPGSGTPSGTSTPTDGANEKSNSFSSSSRIGGGKGGIPAWQMAAAKKSELENAEKKDVSESGTVTEGGAAST